MGLDTTEIAKLAATGLGAAVQILIATMGVKAAEDVIEGRHFDDDVMVYGFHDSAPHYQIANGGTYGIPYKALRVAGIENLLVAGMMITSDRRAHMSTRNTVNCMGQGQATGTAAALCAAKKCGTRDLHYADLRKALEKGGVYFES